jgi:hypothetical protein
MFKKRIDISGQRFGRLLVIKFTHTDKNKYACWECKCDCGNITNVPGKVLRSKKTKSCGCLHEEMHKAGLNLKHGMCYSREYKCWISMKNRCENANYKDYRYYGGRGIKVCQEWITSFETFYNDLGPKPPKFTLERIENDGDYKKSNCKWASRLEQSNNTRLNHNITFKGETLSISRWAEKAKIDKHIILNRIRRGYPIEYVLYGKYKLTRDKCHFSKLTTEQANDVIKMRSELIPYKHIAAKYNMSISALEKIISKNKKFK